MSRIKTALFEKSSSKESECPKTKLPEYAFIGRSNVGKSSLINLLTNNKKLAKTSGRPGKTQLINHFLIDAKWYLVDLPGYGWAQVSKTDKARWKKMIDHYLLERSNLVSVFVLLDSRHPPQKIDLEFMSWLGSHGIPFAMVFTKVDKQSKNQTQANVAHYKKSMLREWESLPPIFLSSTVSGEGQDIVDYIVKLNQTAFT
ncbi:MAG: ribosome biogenesis GTP-binding protein YihA/YsxC [Bacteroidota bacterium]